MEQIKNKILKIIFFAIFIIGISTIVNAKYKIYNEFCVANLTIDREKPNIEIVEIQNNNPKNKEYANKTHTINIKVKITEKYIKDIYLDQEHIKIKIGNQENTNAKISIKEVETITNGNIYDIELQELLGDGNLEIQILEGTVIDTSELKNELKEIDTNIIIDNTTSTWELLENMIDEEKVNEVIETSKKALDQNYASQYSIVYQILLEDVGWSEVCLNGQEYINKTEKIIYDFRVALVPKAEEQYVIDIWNKDIGTYNQ